MCHPFSFSGHIQVRGHQIADERAAAGNDVYGRDGPVAGRGTKGRDAQRGKAQGRIAARTAAGTGTAYSGSRSPRSALNKNTLHNTFVIYFLTHFRAHRSSSFGGGPRDPALPQCGRRCRGDLSRTTGTASGRTSTKWWRWSAKTTTTCRPYTGPGFRTSVVEGADRTL